MSALRIQLGQFDRVVVTTPTYVEQRIPVPAVRADEVTAVVIDLRLNRREFDISMALLASPHRNLLRNPRNCIAASQRSAIVKEHE